MFVNCTPHPINLLDSENKLVMKLPKGDVVPRLTQTTKVEGEIHGVTITSTQFGATQDLPDSIEGVLYIVSRLVLQANPSRNDLVVPNELVRDAEGNILGCKSLAKN